MYIYNQFMNYIKQNYSKQDLSSGGKTPPRPGLVWNPITHRWIRPNKKEKKEDSEKQLTKPLTALKRGDTIHAGIPNKFNIIPVKYLQSFEGRSGKKIITIQVPGWDEVSYITEDSIYRT